MIFPRQFSRFFSLSGSPEKTKKRALEVKELWVVVNQEWGWTEIMVSSKEVVSPCGTLGGRTDTGCEREDRRGVGE